MQDGALNPEPFGFLDKMWHLRNKGATKTHENWDKYRQPVQWLRTQFAKSEWFKSSLFIDGWWLLSDTKPPKNSPQNIAVHIDGSRDASDLAKRLPQIKRYQVAGNRGH